MRTTPSSVNELRNLGLNAIRELESPDGILASEPPIQTSSASPILLTDQQKEVDVQAPSKIFSVLELEALLCRMVTPLGLQASDNDLFKGSIFGRDSLISLDFLLESEGEHSWLSDLVLTSLSRTRGLKDTPRLEEQPGKFAHELRLRGMPGMNLETYDRLADMFGEYIPGALLIYPTVDTTPLALIAAARHVRRWGSDILRKPVGHIDPTIAAKPLGDVLRDGLEWMVRTIEASPLGLLEYARGHQEGHEFHVLEDGKISYRHEDGSYPNLVDRIAFLTPQGHAHEALLSMADLFPNDPEESHWVALARRLQEQTLRHFWMPERQTFACALDCNPHTGDVRQMATLSTVQPSILDSTLFDGLGPEARNEYVRGVLRNLFTPEFLTDVGLRSLALRYDDQTPYWAYQGTRSVWPVLTHRAARGCRRQGYLGLAADLDARMLNGLQTMGEMRELMYVSPEGQPVYDPESRYADGEVTQILAPEYGQAFQTWTIAAAVAAKHWLGHPYTFSTFEHELLGTEPTALWSEQELKLAFANRMQVVIDRKGAHSLEAKLADSIR
jgi:glycogen debranching enzyme